MEVGRLRRIDAKPSRIVFIISEKSGHAVKDAPTVLRHDKLIVLAAVQRYRNELKLRTDPEVLLAAVTQYGSTLLYAVRLPRSDYGVRFLRSDENIVLVALTPTKRGGIRSARRLQRQTGVLYVQYATAKFRSSRIRQACENLPDQDSVSLSN